MAVLQRFLAAAALAGPIAGLDAAGLRAKHISEFEKPGAPVMDFVFTVCDNAAGEVCPFWPGQPVTAHWGLEDPAAVEGSDEDKREAFRKTAMMLNRRIELFSSLPLDKLDRMALTAELGEIGKHGA